MCHTIHRVARLNLAEFDLGAVTKAMEKSSLGRSPHARGKKRGGGRKRKTPL